VKARSRVTLIRRLTSATRGLCFIRKNREGFVEVPPPITNIAAFKSREKHPEVQTT
jgi:hypothetical protein